MQNYVNNYAPLHASEHKATFRYLLILILQWLAVRSCVAVQAVCRSSSGLSQLCHRICTSSRSEYPMLNWWGNGAYFFKYLGRFHCQLSHFGCFISQHL